MQLGEAARKQLANAPNFEVLETILYTPEAGFVLLDRHIDRLCRTVKEIGPPRFPDVPDIAVLRSQLNELCTSWGCPHKVRLLFNGIRCEIDCQPFSLWTASQKHGLKVSIDTVPVQIDDVFLKYKTTHRKTYNEARARAKIGSPEGNFDVILFNTKYEVTETSICNIAVENEHGCLVTPSLFCGLLNGVQREEMLSKAIIHEGVVTLSDLRANIKAGRRIICFNSVRGVFDVTVTE
eukprot:CFRG8478T1